MKTAEPGSVSTDTLKPEHLLSAFQSALSALCADSCPQGHLGIDWEPKSVENQEWAAADAFEALEEHAPDGHYFGAHWGDGADFGFWPVERED